MSPTTSVTLPINSYLDLCFSRNLGLHFCVHVLSDRFLDLRFHIWDVASDFLTWGYSWRRKLDWIWQFYLQCSTRNSTATFFNYSTALIHFFFPHQATKTLIRALWLSIFMCFTVHLQTLPFQNHFLGLQIFPQRCLSSQKCFLTASALIIFSFNLFFFSETLTSSSFPK